MVSMLENKFIHLNIKNYVENVVWLLIVYCKVLNANLIIKININKLLFLIVSDIIYRNKYQTTVYLNKHIYYRI